MKGKAKLPICLVNGKIHSVSDFAHLSRKNRPSAFCPECHQPVVLKLSSSEKPIHHAAHKSENTSCSLSTNEGILHFYTKWYISEQLKSGNKLFIKQNCTGWKIPDKNIKRDCRTSSRAFLWLQNWDDVKIERKVDSLRPDIILYRDQLPVAAIEICVTHAVNEEKKQKFQSMNLPWIEIQAEGEDYDEYFVDWAEEFENDEFPWKIGKPLIYHNCFPSPEDWTCNECIEAPNRYLERLREIEEQNVIRENEERYEQLNRLSKERERERKQYLYLQKQDNYVLKAIAVIWLKPFGNSEIFELFVIERHNSEHPYEPVEIYLKVGEFDGKIIASEEPIKENSKRIIFDKFKEWKKEKVTISRKMEDLTGWVTESELKNLRGKYEKLNPFEWRGTYWAKKSHSK